MSQGEKTKEQQDKENNQLGCLYLIGIIGILFFVGVVWTELFGSESESSESRAMISVAINERMIGTLVLGGPDCDMSGYDLEILDEDGRSVARKNLGSGWLSSDGVFCNFTVSMDVKEMDQYRVFIGVHSGDTRIAAKTLQHEDVVNEDGTLDMSVRWYNHRDED